MERENPHGELSNWTVRDVAEFLGVSEKTIRRYVDAGIIPHKAISRGLRRTIRFNPQAIEQWMQVTGVSSSQEVSPEQREVWERAQEWKESDELNTPFE